jgi:hypothetical protein
MPNSTAVITTATITANVRTVFMGPPVPIISMGWKLRRTQRMRISCRRRDVSVETYQAELQM